METSGLTRISLTSRISVRVSDRAAGVGREITQKKKPCDVSYHHNRNGCTTQFTHLLACTLNAESMACPNLPL